MVFDPTTDLSLEREEAEFRIRTKRAQLEALNQNYRQQLKQRGVEDCLAADVAFILAYRPISSRTQTDQWAVEQALQQILQGGEVDGLV